MKKDKYIDISFKRKLPGRCPIFEYCERRAMTVYILSEYSQENYSNSIRKTLEKANEIPNDFEENCITIKGDKPEILRGNEHGYFANMCPEINLFEGNHSFGMARETACTKGNWNKERKTVFEPTEFKHYSECLEFSNHIYENKFSFGSETKLQKNTNKPCYIYLMINRKNSHYKIGISEDPNYREKTLQSEEPQIETIATKKFITRRNASNLEKKLHKKFEHLNVRGEWFKLEQYQIEYILTEFESKK